MVDQIMVVPFIIALAQVVKGFGLDAKYIPLFNIIIGVFIHISLNGFTIENAFIGMALGLSSSGLYDAQKSFQNK